MLGLWSLGKTPVGFTLHVAFEVAKMDYLLKTPKWLKALGITPLSFYSIESEEPSVIGWMPAAAIYFRDPDGHLIEYLTMLKEKEPKHDIRVIGWFEWLSIGRDRLQQDQQNNN
jgi:lactoylglutathione lyase